MNKETKTTNDTSQLSTGSKTVTTPNFQNNLVSKVNALTQNHSVIYTNFQPKNINSDKNVTLDYQNVICEINKLSNINGVHDYFAKIYSIIMQNIKSDFIAYGFYKELSNCINLRLLDKLGNSYMTKVFMKDDDNPIIQSFNTKKSIFCDNVRFLQTAYFRDNPVVILPLISIDGPIGIMIINDNNARLNINLYTLIANISALYAHNSYLITKTEEYANTDNLTMLYNHRGFQEMLLKEIKRAQINKQKLSVVMMDICNITKINREFGHAKGDDVIKFVAEKVRQNVREGDIAARYGGDEIGIILPNTTADQAKYIAEYLTYSLSCCFIDDLGPVKVSVGISTYPDNSEDKEKLLALTEQAMYISKAKGYKDGMSAIISSGDFNFWDDVALKSYAEVLSKRNLQLGIDFEEELISQFNAEHAHDSSRIADIAVSLASAIDAKDPYTKGHSTSVSKFSEALARAINLPEAEVERIKLGALLHDVGKIGIPETVLKKEGPLSDEEWKIMKQHPTIGTEKVLMPNPTLRDLIPIVKYHHERLDGKGYPDGLKGDEIPLVAKIVAIADTYHALISDRPYRKGMDFDKAISILQEGAGTQWDADLIRTFIQIAPSLGV